MTFSKLIRKIRDWQRERDAVIALSSRSDRELEDLGLVRADIARAVRNPRADVF